MCNSYSQGYCNYYGVKVSELNNKCDRGQCMTSERMKDLSANVKLDNPNMRMYQELLIYLSEEEVKRLKEIEEIEDHWRKIE